MTVSFTVVDCSLMSMMWFGHTVTITKCPAESESSLIPDV